MLLLTLDQLHVDFEQPRRYLGTYRTIERVTDPAVLMRLLREAESTDDEARAYLDDIRDLARSIRVTGLLQPIVVRDAVGTPDAQRYTIVDGERRFWAHVWLAAMGECGDGCVVPCERIAGSLAPDGVLQRQWTSSVQRRELSCIEIGYWIAMRLDQILRNIADGTQAPTAAVTEHMLNHERDTAAYLLAADELLRLSGREFSLRNLRRYRQWVRELSQDAQRLASAYQAGPRVLDRIVRIKNPESQLKALRIELGLEQSSAQAKTGGRPTRLQRCQNLVISAGNACEKLDASALDAAAIAQARDSVAEMEMAVSRISACVHRLRTRLAASPAA